MFKLNLLNKQWEIAYLGCIKKGSIIILGGPFTNYSNDFVIIPPNILMKLLVFCVKNDLSPIIIHNHTNNSSFSIPDRNFLKSIEEIYYRNGGSKFIYLGLINSKTGDSKVICNKSRRK
ncbi:hypothetical protein [Dubosiella newyorkensis]|uniref:RadC-like JAB domain-containing protein n=1 Tax=Dubosiella newyorkensis TaxID=1862672 RepID=A0A1U7NJL7_9FIRM|nr:hypothetical protein [Dubosiella newyorkensis]OLU43744.1 hypothetical protein BO225_11675 [Dubosiella newyorkensis]